MGYDHIIYIQYTQQEDNTLFKLQLRYYFTITHVLEINYYKYYRII